MTCPKKPEPAGAAPPSQTARAPSRAGLAQWAGTRYWVCLGVLVCAAVGLKATARGLGMALRKEAVPLKQPLQFFDARKLAPDYELNKRLTDRQEPMSEDMIETLGTQDYLQIYLTDTRKPQEDRTQVALLFVTYYTGKPDLVPHEPDVCWAAAGYDRVSAASDRVQVRGAGLADDDLPIRVLEFRATQQDRLSTTGADVATVIYFFHTNGHYALTRNDVRKSMSNPFQRAAYYLKVEVTFSSGGLARAGKEESVAAVGPLMERVMPVLLNDHIDLEKLGSAGSAVRAGT